MGNASRGNNPSVQIQVALEFADPWGRYEGLIWELKSSYRYRLEVFLAHLVNMIILEKSAKSFAPVIFPGISGGPVVLREVSFPVIAKTGAKRDAIKYLTRNASRRNDGESVDILVPFP